MIYLIEDAHCQHGQGCVYNIVEGDEILVVDGLNERTTANKWLSPHSFIYSM